MTSGVRSHRDLVVWQKAMDFAVEAYKIGDTLPAKEQYGLRSQLTRAAASVSANIAEGSVRGSHKDYSRFLAIAKGSLMEAETYLMLAVRLGYINQKDVEMPLDIVTQISKTITSMRNKLDA